MSTSSWTRWAVVALAAGCAPAWGEDQPPEAARYVRPAADGFATECQFQITRGESGWTITSRTDRGDVRMDVETRYDAENRPVGAKAVLKTRDSTRTVTVQVDGGRATVRRDA